MADVVLIYGGAVFEKTVVGRLCCSRTGGGTTAGVQIARRGQEQHVVREGVQPGDAWP